MHVSFYGHIIIVKLSDSKQYTQADHICPACRHLRGRGCPAVCKLKRCNQEFSLHVKLSVAANLGVEDNSQVFIKHRNMLAASAKRCAELRFGRYVQ